MERVRIVLCGRSILMGTLGASLRRVPGLEVVAVAATSGRVEPLAALAPDVILFDTSAPPAAAFALLQNCPGLRLIGLDPDRNHTVVWSAQQLEELSLGDLLRVLRDRCEAAGPAGPLPAGETS